MDKLGCASAIKARFIALGLHKFSENRIFTDADDYSMEIELPIVDCPQNLDIFEMITRKDVGLAHQLARQNCKRLNFVAKESKIAFFGLSGKLVGASMRSKDLAKATGLAVAFDHTAPTFYRVSRFLEGFTS